MHVANSKDRIDMTIRMQKAWDPSVKEPKPIVGEGGNRWMGSGKSQLDDPPSPPGLIIKTMIEVRWRRTIKKNVRNARGGLSIVRVFYLYLI